MKTDTILSTGIKYLESCFRDKERLVRNDFGTDFAALALVSRLYIEGAGLGP